MKVRIKETPRERELDGIRLDRLFRGMVRDVAPSLGAWLVAQGYADCEMRRGRDDEFGFSTVKEVRQCADNREQRRSTDRSLQRRSTDR